MARTVSTEGAQTKVATCRLDVHGLRLAVHGEWLEVVQAVALDFAWFAADPQSPAEVSVEVQRRPPDFDSLGEQRASFITPRNVVYGGGERTVVDYFGRAVCVVSDGGDRALAQGEDLHLVHEAVYLFLLSRVGEHLDRVGLPRLHALGLSGSDGGVAVMLPSGGGKSTLALRAIRDERVRVLSEDTPLIDRHGRMHPFPLRIGVNATDAESMPDHHVRRIQRMEFHPKLVLDLEAFADHIETEPQPLRHLVIGVRSLGNRARLEPLPRRAAAAPLFREAVVGVGVYQGMEFVLQRGLRDVLGKTGIAATRARCCAAGLARAKVWELTLGRDHDANWRALAPLLGG